MQYLDKETSVRNTSLICNNNTFYILFKSFAGSFSTTYLRFDCLQETFKANRLIQRTGSGAGTHKRMVKYGHRISLRDLGN